MLRLLAITDKKVTTVEAMALLKENGELKSQLNITKQALVDIALIDFFGALTAEKAVDKARKTLREIGGFFV